MFCYINLDSLSSFQWLSETLKKGENRNDVRSCFPMIKNITKKSWLITILKREIEDIKKGGLSFPFSSAFFKKKKSARLRLIQ
jgi:hypothetical protein